MRVGVIHNEAITALSRDSCLDSPKRLRFVHSDKDKGTRAADNDEMEFTVSLDLIITIATIAAFGLAVVVAVGNMSRNLRNELRGDIRSLEQKMDHRFEAVDQRFEAVDLRFEAVDRRFEAIDRKFEAVDTELRAVGAQIQELRKDVLGQQRAQDQRIDTAMALAAQRAS